MCSVQFYVDVIEVSPIAWLERVVPVERLDLNELYQLKKPQFPSLDAAYLRNT